jgi:hypothetical protein
VEGNHEAIISPAVFDMVQAELAKRTLTEFYPSVEISGRHNQ